jgi:hypothetical protein
MVGGSGAQADTGLNAMFFSFNRDPRMKQLYLDYLAACRQAGGELFMHYYDVGKFTQWGSWERGNTWTNPAPWRRNSMRFRRSLSRIKFGGHSDKIKTANKIASGNGRAIRAAIRVSDTIAE